MRRVLVDHARSRASARRGGRLRITLEAGHGASAPPEPDLLDLDAALDQLAALDDRQARLVELRFFGGLTSEEAAQALGISLCPPRTGSGPRQGLAVQEVEAGSAGRRLPPLLARLLGPEKPETFFPRVYASGVADPLDRWRLP